MNGAPSPEVFDLFTDGVRSSARRYCRNQGVPADYVDDVVSDAMVRAVGTLGRQDVLPEDFPAWFMGVTRHAIAEYWKVKGPEVPLEDWMWRPTTRDPAPETNATIAVGQFFRRLGPLLSPRDRQVLSLYLQVANRRMTQAGLAKELGVDPNGASMFLKGWRDRVQEAMLALAFLDDPGEGERRCGYLDRVSPGEPSEELRKEITRHLDGTKTKPACRTCRRRRPAMVTFVSGIARALPGIVLPVGHPAHVAVVRRGHALRAGLAMAAGITTLMVVSAVSVGNATIGADARPQGQPVPPPPTSDTSPATRNATTPAPPPRAPRIVVPPAPRHPTPSPAAEPVVPSVVPSVAPTTSNQPQSSGNVEQYHVPCVGDRWPDHVRAHDECCPREGMDGHREPTWWTTPLAH